MKLRKLQKSLKWMMKADDDADCDFVVVVGYHCRPSQKEKDRGKREGVVMWQKQQHYSWEVGGRGVV